MVNKPVHEHITQVTFHIVCVALKLTESIGVHSQLDSKSSHLAATGFSLSMSNFKLKFSSLKSMAEEDQLPALSFFSALILFTSVSSQVSIAAGVLLKLRWRLGDAAWGCRILVFRYTDITVSNLDREV